MLVQLTATDGQMVAGSTKSWGGNIEIVVLFLTKKMTSGHEINFLFFFFM